ncbi:uncharacterized protein [Halyomorpha halys]|uniref:uncharacterized protein n=1 Tax=Halyomorpha halys TaxID=286706 RepID=UPI0034D2FA77
MNNVSCMVQIGGQRLEEFPSIKGLPQGDDLAYLLLDLALEKAVRDAEIQTNANTVQLLAYADDIDIIGRSFLAVSDVFLALVGPARRLCLEANSENTKYMVTGEVTRPGERVTFGEHQLEKTNVFVYLGSLVIQEN